MINREKVINDLQDAVNDDWMWQHADYYAKAMENAIDLLKEQEAEIRQLKLALNIAKGTCKGIIAEGR